jgi:hypothetical protein
MYRLYQINAIRFCHSNSYIHTYVNIYICTSSYNNYIIIHIDNKESIQSDFAIEIAGLQTQLDEERLHAGTCLTIFIYACIHTCLLFHVSVDAYL